MAAPLRWCHPSNPEGASSQDNPEVVQQPLHRQCLHFAPCTMFLFKHSAKCRTHSVLKLPLRREIKLAVLRTVALSTTRTVCWRRSLSLWSYTLADPSLSLSSPAPSAQPGLSALRPWLIVNSADSTGRLVSYCCWTLVEPDRELPG